MDPFSHVLVPVGGLGAYTVFKEGVLPDGDVLLLVAFAAFLPDLVDKPLAWTFGVTSSGRLVAHSVVVALPIAAAMVAVAVRFGDGRYGYAYALGHLSHVALDYAPVLWMGTGYYYFPNLFWPFLPPNPDLDTTYSSRLSDPGVLTFVLLGGVLVVGGYALLDSYRRRQQRRE